MTVTKIKMDAGIRSNIDAKRIRSDWKVLRRHYEGARHARALDEGVRQLKKLSMAQAQDVIHKIRISIEPSLNWAMEEKVMKIGLSLPIAGRIGIGNLRFTLRGTRVAMRSLRNRGIRLLIQSTIWLSVAAGSVHWISWTFFNEPFLVSTFANLAKLTQFILLISTTLIVWVLARAKRDDSTATTSPFAPLIRSLPWGIVILGWCHFVVWFLPGLSIEFRGLEGVAQLLLPFFLVSGGLAAWVSGRVFREEGNADD